jgi:hypothetical protein
VAVLSSITLTLITQNQPVSLPGSAGQSGVHGRPLLDRPVEPADDSEASVSLNEQRSKPFAVSLD